MERKFPGRKFQKFGYTSRGCPNVPENRKFQTVIFCRIRKRSWLRIYEAHKAPWEEQNWLTLPLVLKPSHVSCAYNF